MRLVTYMHAGRTLAGLLVGDAVIDLSAAAGQCAETLDTSSVLTIVRAGEVGVATLQRIAARAGQLSAVSQPLSAVKLLAPIPQPPRNVFCVGRNYAEHVKEGAAVLNTGTKLPEVPQFFTKATHAVNSPDGDIRLDANVTRRLDYEVELVVVIGTGGRDIRKEDAFKHVYGYCVGNDFSARDLQRRHDQWFKGKSLDTLFPFGPALVTKDEVGDVSALQLSLTVNGELRQQAPAAEMIFDIPTIIASLSAGMTLESGDVIATGTPSGVGFAMNPPQYLKDGDMVVAGIGGLGELRNKVVAV